MSQENPHNLPNEASDSLDNLSPNPPEVANQTEGDNSQIDHRPKYLREAIYQGELHAAPYALTVTSPKIEPVDKRLLKANAHESMQHQAEQQISMLRKQAELLIKQAKAIEERLEVSHTIYKADINFEPVIHGVYHLYQKEDGTQVLSMVAPYEWGNKLPYQSWLHTVRLLADKTWDIIA